MKKKHSKLLFWGWVITATIMATFWWFNSIYAVPFSEFLWTQYNRLLGGQKPGLSSDLEFLTVIAGAAVISGFLAWLVSLLVGLIRKYC
ncbi:MAG: hypothetical protein AAFZ92_11280 [Pseudomonadota bacterium]